MVLIWGRNKQTGKYAEKRNHGTFFLLSVFFTDMHKHADIIDLHVDACAHTHTYVYMYAYSLLLPTPTSMCTMLPKASTVSSIATAMYSCQTFSTFTGNEFDKKTQ